MHASFLSQHLADELVLFVAPKVFGHSGLTWSGALGPRAPAVELTQLSAELVGGDVLITGLFPPRVPRRRAAQRPTARSVEPSKRLATVK